MGEAVGTIINAQDARGHKHAATTRVHVQRVAVKKDRHIGPFRLNSCSHCHSYPVNSARCSLGTVGEVDACIGGK